MGRTAENKKYPFHFPLETEKLSLQCLNLCHPVIRTIWHAAGLSPLLTKLFVVLPWQKQSISRSTQRHSVTRIKGWISSWLSVRENKCPHMFFFYCFCFVSFVLVVPDLCCWSCAQAGKELKKKSKSLKKVQACETMAWKVEFQVLLRRLLLNEQITHEWHRAVSPNFPGNLHCTFKINNNEIWPEWSSMKGIRSLS